jgi:hypothetical protein
MSSKLAANVAASVSGRKVPHPRRVDHAGAAGQAMQRARGRRVHAATVALAHRAGVLRRRAEQRVGQGRLAGARRAEQDQRLPAARYGASASAADGAVASTAKRSICAGRRPCSAAEALFEPARHLRHDVGLGQHDDRLHAAGLHEREIALDAARVEVVVEAHHEQRGVDVADDRVAASVGIARAMWVCGGTRVRTQQSPWRSTLATTQSPTAIRCPALRSRARNGSAGGPSHAGAVVQMDGLAVDLDQPHQASGSARVAEKAAASAARAGVRPSERKRSKSISIMG